MFTIDYTIFFVLCLFTLVSTIFFTNLVDNVEKKLIILFPTISIFVYSGVGISFEDVSNKYLMHYFIFLVIFQFCLCFSIRNAKISSSFEDKFFKYFNNKQIRFILKLLAIVYLSTYIVDLLYPTNRLNLLWNPPRSSILVVFANEERRTLSMTSYTRLLLLSFTFIYLYTLILRKKKYIVIIYILTWFYLKYVCGGYISRNEIVAHLLLFYFLFRLNTGRNGEVSINFSIRDIFVLSCVMIILIPFMFLYLNFRSTGYWGDSINFSESLSGLVDSECYYPKYYEVIEQSKKYTFRDIISWVLFLPVPSYLFPWKPTISINYDFTELVAGELYGSINYGVCLPSLLGEAFFLYGLGFYFFHAIMITLIVGTVFNQLLRSNYFLIIRLYLVLEFMKIGRGGCTSIISTCINGMFSLLLFILIITLQEKILRKK